MIQKHNNSSRSLTLAFVLLIGIGGLLGALSSGFKVTLAGSVLVLVAFAEAAAILVGLSAFQRRQRPVEMLEEERD